MQELINEYSESLINVKYRYYRGQPQTATLIDDRP